jgi:hypothetical protein
MLIDVDEIDLAAFDHTDCAKYDHELGETQDDVPYTQQRAAFHLCEEMVAARTDKSRLLKLLYLIGPERLSMLNQLEDALVPYGATIEDVADCVRYDELIERIVAAS